MRVPVWLPLALASCAAPLDLPPPPAQAPPSVARLEPDRAFAGDRVRVLGAALGTAATARVRFGDGEAAAPADAATDGTWLEVAVPPDGAGGAVEVATPAGRATGPALEYLGLGHLRARLVEGRESTEAAIGAVVPLADDTLLVFSEEGVYRLRGRSSVERLEPGAAYHTVQVLDAGRFAALLRPAGPGGAWRLVVRRADAPGTDEAAVAFAAPDEIDKLAVSADGLRAVVTLENGTALLADLAAGTTVHLQPPADAHWSAVTAAGGARFLLPSPVGTDVLDAATASVVERLDRTSGYHLSPPVAGIAVDLRGSRRAEVLDFAHWPPRLLASVALPRYVDRVAVAPAGDRFVAWTWAEGVVVARDADGWRPVASFEPGGAHVAWAGRRFFAAHRGAVREYSAEGALLEKRVLDTEPSTLALTRCGTTQALVVGRGNGSPVVLDARSLAPTDACPGPWTPGTALVASWPGAAELYAVEGAVLRRFRAGAREDAAADLEALLDFDAPQRLQLCDRGRLLVVTGLLGTLLVADVSGNLPPARTRLLEGADPLVAPACDESGRLVWATEYGVQVLDLARAFDGAEPAFVSTEPETIQGLASARDVVAVLAADLGAAVPIPVKLRSLDAVRLAITESVPLPGVRWGDNVDPSFTTVLASADGRTLEWLETPSLVGGGLHGAGWDPVSGRLLGQLAPVILGDPLALLQDPTGERIWVLDADGVVSAVR